MQLLTRCLRGPEPGTPFIPPITAQHVRDLDVQSVRDKVHSAPQIGSINFRAALNGLLAKGSVSHIDLNSSPPNFPVFTIDPDNVDQSPVDRTPEIDPGLLPDPRLVWRIAECGTRASLADFGLGRPVLFTASIAFEETGRWMHAFAAFLAVDEEDALRKLRPRLGPQVQGLILRAGFDPSEPIASELLSLPLVDILLDVDHDPLSPLAAGLDVYLEHQFAT